MKLEEVIEKVERERLITHTNDEHSKVVATAVREAGYKKILPCPSCGEADWIRAHKRECEL